MEESILQTLIVIGMSFWFGFLITMLFILKRKKDTYGEELDSVLKMELQKIREKKN